MVRADDESFIVGMETESIDPESGKVVKTHVPFEEGDTVYFTVRKVVKMDSQDDNWLIQKVITKFTEGFAEIKLEPSDTENIKYDKYIYDCELIDGNGKATTFIGALQNNNIPPKFILLGEVT